jgi:5-methylcytosine-specific restriction enzyme A
MTRSVPEWCGRTADTPVPPRVRLRILEKFGNRCDPDNNGCGRALVPGDKWTCDHIVALINGGPNRESNLHPLCAWCVKAKDRADVALKSRSYKRRASHAGIKRGRPSRQMPGSKSSPWKKTFNHGWVRRDA